MALRLTVVSRHGPRLGTHGVKEFGPGGGTIGRSLECTWPLPDSKRFLSSRHASIDFRSGSYYIVDTSMNGVYVNGAEHPVGRGTPQRLFDGDTLRIGEYEVSVEIDEDPIAPLIDENHIDPVDIAQRVEAPEPTGNDMVDAYEITGVGIEMMLTDDELETLSPPPKSRGAYLEIVDDDPPAHKRASERKPDAHSASATLHSAPAASGTASAAAALPPQPAAAAPAARRSSGAPTPTTDGSAVFSLLEDSEAAPTEAAIVTPTVTPQRAGTPRSAARAAAPKKAAPVSAAARTLQPAPAQGTRAAAAASAGGAPASRATANTVDLEPFFRGAGISAQVSPQQTDAFLFRLGQVTRTMLAGITESLHLRAEQKNALRLPSTTIQPQDNNPLKLSAGVDEAFANLLLRDSAAHLAPAEAVREAFDDLQLHQRLLLKALRTSLDAFLARLDPDELEHKFARGRANVLKNAANRLKYWDLYKDLYDVVAHHPPGELPMQFLDDFVDAYQHELEDASDLAAPAEDRHAS